jgi:MFS superfamily sulfate permease-like transporter
LFPERSIGVSRVSMSYGVMNILNAFLGGIPVCHGSGGMAGHYLFGGRTGGSVVLYGAMFLTAGLFFSDNVSYLVQIFPFPVLGVILFFEGLALMSLLRDLRADRRDLYVALVVGILANALPYGFLIGLLIGTALYYGQRKIFAGVNA